MVVVLTNALWAQGVAKNGLDQARYIRVITLYPSIKPNKSSFAILNNKFKTNKKKHVYDVGYLSR